MSEPKVSQSKKSFEDALSEFLKQYDCYIHSMNYEGIIDHGILTIGVKRFEANEINET